PFRRYSAATSASRPKNATLCHSVRSCQSPVCLSFHASLVASRTFVTALPFGMERVSGSAPKRPISCTLFKLRTFAPSAQTPPPAPPPRSSRTVGPPSPSASPPCLGSNPARARARLSPTPDHASPPPPTSVDPLVRSCSPRLPQLPRLRAVLLRYRLQLFHRVMLRRMRPFQPMHRLTTYPFDQPLPV